MSQTLLIAPLTFRVDLEHIHMVDGRVLTCLPNIRRASNGSSASHPCRARRADAENICKSPSNHSWQSFHLQVRRRNVSRREPSFDLLWTLIGLRLTVISVFPIPLFSTIFTIFILNAT